MGVPTDELEGRHRVPDAICEDAPVEDELVDELPDETREDGEEELIRKIKKGHTVTSVPRQECPGTKKEAESKEKPDGDVCGIPFTAIGCPVALQFRPCRR